MRTCCPPSGDTKSPSWTEELINFMSTPNTPTPTPNTFKPLNPATAAQLAHGYARYAQLTQELSSGVITPEVPTKAAELEGLRKHLNISLLNHAGELLGAWNIVRTEYEPALRAVATVFGRVGLLGQPEAQQPAPAPTNVEPLNP